MALTDVLNDRDHNPTLADVCDMIDTLDRRVENEFNTVLFRENTDATVANTVTETTIWSDTVPANTLATDRMIRFEALFSHTNNTGSNRQTNFLVYYGSSIGIAAELAFPSSSNVRPILISGFIQADLSTQQQNVDAWYRSGVTGTDSGNSADLYSSRAGMKNINEDSTTALTMSITVQHAFASASLTTTFRGIYVEVL